MTYLLFLLLLPGSYPYKKIIQTNAFNTLHAGYRDFPRPDLGQTISPFPIKKKRNQQKLFKMVYIIPNFLVLLHIW